MSQPTTASTASTESQTAQESGRMRDTLRRPRHRRDYHDNDLVVRDLGLAWGMRPSSVRQLLYGRHRLDGRLIDVISAFRRHGAHERLARWSAGIRVALAGVESESLTGQLLRDVQLLDLAEDAAETEFRLAADRASAVKWIAAIDRLIHGLLRVRQALIDRFHLEES